jgi:hypothetical protein
LPAIYQTVGQQYEGPFTVHRGSAAGRSGDGGDNGGKTLTQIVVGMVAG